MNKRLISSSFICFAVLLFALLPCIAGAQSTEKEIAARLLKQPLYLRGAWGESELEFDSNGHPAQSYETIPFTTAAVEVTKVDLKDAHLEIEGQRVGLEIDPNGRLSRVPFVWKHHDGRISIRIDATPGTDFGPALDAIFARDLAGVPSADRNGWQLYASSHWLRRAEPDPNPGGAGTQADEDVRMVGGSVQPPHLLYRKDPEATEVARALRYAGETIISARVEPDGKTSHLLIDLPAGLGLDEQALVAVAEYRFSPATEHGVPVPVQLFVTVKFGIE